MLKLLKYFKPKEWIMCVFVVAIIVGQVWLEMRLIRYMGEIVSLIQNYASGMGQLSAEILWGVGWKMLACAGLMFVAATCVNFLASMVAAGFAKRLRFETFKKVNNFSMEEMNKFSTASLITRSTNDIKQVEQTIFMSLRMAIMAPTMAAFSIKEIIGGSMELTWTTVGALTLMFGLVMFMVFVAVPKFSKIQKKTDRINAVTRENLTGLRVVRAYNAEQEQQEKFEEVNKDLTKTTLFVNRVTAFLFPGMDIIMNGLSLAIYWFGAYLINLGSIEYFTLVTFTQYAMHVLMSFMFISMLFIMIPRGIVSARRIKEVLSTQTKIHDGADVEQKTSKGTIVFKNVGFRYPDAEVEVLENISFVANQGETVAFIGSTGSGKSTLVNLIPRFFDATSGEILIDGKNIKDYKQQDLSAILGFVPQKGYLFSGTIRSNLAYGKHDATEEEMFEALDIAQASFVKNFEDGLDYEIAQGGTNVSGGQRQRLCIARAVVKKPEI
jgi:ATP-binding cassette subfamily B protein